MTHKFDDPSRLEVCWLSGVRRWAEKRPVLIYSATADLTTCSPWTRALEVATSRRFQADKASQVAKIGFRYIKRAGVAWVFATTAEQDPERPRNHKHRADRDHKRKTKNWSR